MKQKLLYKYLIIIICACAWSGQVWGQQPYYVLEAATGSDNDGASQYNSKDYSLSGKGEHLYFSARKLTGITRGNIEVYVKKNGSWSSDPIYTTSNLSTSPKSFDCAIDADVTDIRFKGNLAGTRYFKDVKVTRATILTPSPSGITFPEATVGTTLSEDVTVAYSNGYESQTVIVETSSPGFSVTNTGVSTVTSTHSEAVEAQTISFKVSFTPTEAGNYSGTVTLKLKAGNNVTKSVNLAVSGTGSTAKANTSFTWTIPSTAYTNRMYVEAFKTSNYECNPTIEVLTEGMAPYVQYTYTQDGGNLFFTKAGNVSIKFHQDETSHFKEKSETYNFTIEEPQNHVEFKIDSEAKYNIFVVEKNKSNDYYGFDNDKGIRLGTENIIIGASETSDKYAVLEFSGIPDKLSFTTSTAGAATSVVFYVQELNENGVPIGQQWYSTSKQNTVENRQLQPATRKLKVCYSGNYWGFFKDIHVTERHELSANKTNLHFGKNNVKGNAVNIQNFTLSHYNAGANVTLTSSDGIYNVSPNAIQNSGKDLWGTPTISVECLNNVVGIHNATITIEDVNGGSSKLPNVVINVTDTTWTTYYTRAAATTAGGGSAYITYDSSLANSTTDTSTSKVESGLVYTANASKTVYLRAVPADGYRFVRWQKGGSQVSTTATCSVSYDYNSESSTNPPTETYTAVFEPKTLTLDPTTSPSYEVGKYAGVITLNRTLPAGYSTIALPFATTVVTLTGRPANDNDWVAQLKAVTYNGEDGYTLYFAKSENGAIAANQPYVLHLGTAVASPSWSDLTVNTATATTIAAQAGYGDNVGADGTYASWSMSSNFAKEMSMNGLYGIVNTGANNQEGQGGLKLGGANSYLNAFTAYITPPASVAQNKPLRIRMAYIDEDGTTTFVGTLPEDGQQNEPIAIYGPDGQRRSRLQRGVNIVRYSDGSVKKMQY